MYIGYIIYNSRNYKGLLDNADSIVYRHIYNSRNYKGLLDSINNRSPSLIYNSRNYKGLLDAFSAWITRISTTVEIIRVS